MGIAVIRQIVEYPAPEKLDKKEDADPPVSCGPGVPPLSEIMAAEVSDVAGRRECGCRLDSYKAMFLTTVTFHSFILESLVSQIIPSQIAINGFDRVHGSRVHGF